MHARHVLRAAILVLAVSIGVSLPTGVAAAHAALISSDPADGAALAASPSQITLVFSDPLDPALVTIAVTDGSGAVVESPDPTVDTTSVIQPLALPDAGTFTVAYRVVSADGHLVEGSSTFTAPAPPAPRTSAPRQSADEPGSTSAAPTATPQAGNTSAGAETGSSWPVLAVGAAVLLVGAGTVALRHRRNTEPPRSADGP